MMIELLKKSKNEKLYDSSKKDYFDYMAPYRPQASILTGQQKRKMIKTVIKL